MKEAFVSLEKVGGKLRVENENFTYESFIEDDGVGWNVYSEWLLPKNFAIRLNPENWIQHQILPKEIMETDLSSHVELPKIDLNTVKVYSISHGKVGSGFDSPFCRGGLKECLIESVGCS